VTDEALGGVVARLKPEEDGSLSFIVEVAESERGSGRTVAMYHGRRVALGAPRRHGYLFEGRVDAGFRGPVAAWADAVAVFAGEETEGPPPPGTVRFAAFGEAGFVAGARPSAEAFVEHWEPAAPFVFEADGIERTDYRLIRRRSAAGFRTNERGAFEGYGRPFSISRDG
jgi:hypothetical protein